MSPTPILDLERDPPRPRPRWPLYLVGGLIGGAMGAAIEGGMTPQFMLQIPFDGLLFLPLFYLGIALHELGHLMAGRLTGMQPGGIVIGGFILVKSGANWVFKFDYRRLFSGGCAKPLPAEGDYRIAPFAWMVAGGPLVNVALCALSGLWIAYRGASGLFGTFLWTNFFLAALSVFPFSSGAIKSDGARLLLLLRDPAQAQAWIALLMILTEEAGGAKPREWNPELCALAFEPAPRAQDSGYVDLLAVYRALDLGREEEALSRFEACLQHSAKSELVLRHCFFLEAASIAASIRRNPAAARAWFERGRKLRKPDCPDAIEAYIAFCEGRYSDALAHIEAARAYLEKRRFDSGLARFLRERLLDLDRKCRVAMSTALSAETGLP